MRHGVTHRMIDAFRAVVATGSVSQAALALNVSQPSVSRLVADLEARLGLMLFDRRGPRLAARAEALELYDEVEQSFQGLERIVQRGRSIAAHRIGVLTISAIPVVGLTILPDALSLLRQRLVVPEFRLQLGHSQAVLLQLASRHCDFAISSLQPNEATGRRVAWFDVPCVLLLPPGHQLAKMQRAVAPQDIADQPFIALGQGLQTRFGIDRFFSEVGLTPRIVAETQQSISASQLVLAGFGVAITDGLAGRWHAAMGGTVLQLASAPTFSFGLYSAGTETARSLDDEMGTTLRAALEAVPC